MKTKMKSSALAALSLLLLTSLAVNLRSESAHAVAGIAAGNPLMIAGGLMAVALGGTGVGASVAAILNKEEGEGLAAMATFSVFAFAGGVLLLDAPNRAIAFSSLSDESVAVANLSTDEAWAFQKEAEFLNSRLVDLAKEYSGKKIRSLSEAVALVEPILKDLTPDAQIAAAKLLKAAMNHGSRKNG